MRGAECFDTLLEGSFSIHLGVGRRQDSEDNAGLDRGRGGGSGKEIAGK